MQEVAKSIGIRIKGVVFKKSERSILTLSELYALLDQVGLEIEGDVNGWVDENNTELEVSFF